MARLKTDHLELGYGDRVVVADLSLTLPKGKITALVGANGSGKSTLLRALGRLIAPKSGSASLDGKEIQRYGVRDLAQRLALLPQAPEVPADLTVRELVAFGRHPHHRPWRGAAPEDAAALTRALAATGMTAFAERPMGALSGGQRQRAWIAMALAQGTDALLLDEPTTYLDMAHQLEVLQLLTRLNAEEGRTIVMVLHDLNQASRYAHHLVAIAQGRVAVEGPPDVVMNPEMLRRVFAVEADVLVDPRSGAPMCVPHALRPHGNPKVGL